MTERIILITLLTSRQSDEPFVVQNINMVRLHAAASPGSIITYKVCVVINTLDARYAAALTAFIARQMPWVRVVQTESTGMPGKGHNSVLSLFVHSSREECGGEPEYLIPVDGDDLLYPVALERIETYLFQHSPDVLLLPFSDTISLRCNPTTTTVPLNGGSCFLNFNNFIPTRTTLAAWVAGQTSPTTTPLHRTNTGARLLMLSRRSVVELGIKYHEKLWLDDLTPFMKIVEAVARGTFLRIYVLADHDIFLYNAARGAGSLSATSTYSRLTKSDHVDQQHAFDATVAFMISDGNRALTGPETNRSNWPNWSSWAGLGNQEWRAALVAMCVLSSSVQCPHFKVLDKIKFCNKAVASIQPMPHTAGLTEKQISERIRYANQTNNDEMRHIYEICRLGISTDTM